MHHGLIWVWILILSTKSESESEVAQSCLTVCHPMDCSLPGSSVCGIFQARLLEWVAISFFQGIFLKQGLNLGLPHCRQMLYCLTCHQGSTIPKVSSKFKIHLQYGGLINIGTVLLLKILIYNMQCISIMSNGRYFTT